MSKSIGKVFGTGSTTPYGYETNYTNYLRNYDTKNYDSTLNNLTSQALNMSQNLGTVLPAYQFTVDGSDAAQQRVEQATFNAYADQLVPQFAQQTADMNGWFAGIAKQCFATGGVPECECRTRCVQTVAGKQHFGSRF